MDPNVSLYGLLKQAIYEKDYSDAVHFSYLLKENNFFDQKSRQGWRKFKCHIYNDKESQQGCGAEFLNASRDCFSPSLDTCPNCGEEVFPSGGFYDDTLSVNESFNLTNIPESINLPL
jgi:hypothetical protein